MPGLTLGARQGYDFGVIASPQKHIAWLGLLAALLTGCAAAVAEGCMPSPIVWDQPPDDPAIGGAPQPGHYFVNSDKSIWASAWWAAEDADGVWDEDAQGYGIKVGWFRPEGVTLHISGQRLDAPAAPLVAQIPCCYPTRFQATGLIFPTEGCWQVEAQAGDRQLSFVVWVGED
ncbi:MAG: hypothetical protein KIS80_09495 [Anaerolineales bacterium]|nr:hypothetical protein [Anaerolineales bacterium]